LLFEVYFYVGYNSKSVSFIEFGTGVGCSIFESGFIVFFAGFNSKSSAFSLRLT
jgi:hypothetical protein